MPLKRSGTTPQRTKRMPIYEYRCDHCGHEFSRHQRFDEEPVATCPNCGQRPRKLLSKPAIVFKGSGWHVTDYRTSKDGAKGEAAAGTTDAGKDVSKKDASAKKDAGDKKDTTSKKERPSAKSDAAAS